MNRVQKLFWIFAFIAIFSLIADRLLFVLFPIYLIQKQFSATEIGLIFSFAALALVLMRTFIGKLSDKYGRKKIMSFGLLLESIAILFYPAASKLYEFAITKGLGEIGETLSGSVQYSVEADSFPKKIRARYQARLGTIVPFGRAIAMPIGFLIVTYFSFVYGFYVAAASIFVSFLIFVIFYKEKIETRKERLSRTKKYSFKFKLVAFGGALQGFCFTLAYYPAFFILATYLGIGAGLLFLLLLIDYLISIPVVHHLGKRIDSFGRTRSFLFGFVFMAIFTTFYAFASNVLQFLIILIGLSISYFIWRIAFKTVIMDFAKPRIRGEQLGFAMTLEGVGGMFGPLVGGLLIDFFTIRIPFIIAGLLYLSVIILYLKRF
jgi:DHA1 family multidrug resistance protein-like MFS transporter